MAIKSVTLDALPKRTREFSAEDKADAAAIVKAGSNGKYATDGETHKTRAEANAAASKIKRMLIALNSVPDGKVVVTSTRGTDDAGFSWFITFGDAPAEPRRRNRTPKAEAAPTA